MKSIIIRPTQIVNCGVLIALANKELEKVQEQILTIVYGGCSTAKSKHARFVHKYLSAILGEECGNIFTDLSSKNPEDIGGFPVPNHDDEQMKYYGEIVWKKQKKNGIIIINEIDRHNNTLSAALRSYLDRDTQKPAPWSWSSIATANGKSDRVHKLDLHTLTRSCLLYTSINDTVSRAEYKDYMVAKSFHPSVVSLLGVHPPVSFDNWEDMQVCTTRSFAFGSAILTAFEKWNKKATAVGLPLDCALLPCLCGVYGVEAGRKQYMLYKLAALPTLADIVADYNKPEILDESEHDLFITLVNSRLDETATAKEACAVCQYALRYGAEVCRALVQSSVVRFGDAFTSLAWYKTWMLR